VIERERKYRISEPDRSRLAALLDETAELERREVQDTVHFRDATGRLDGLNLRVREIGTQRELTIKGPRLEAGRSKVREEHTVVVEGDLAPLLEALALHPTERYRKRTAIYRFSGALVSLDLVDDVGAFCEIEAHDDATIDQVATRLGLADDAIEPRGYARLVRSRA
jgi:predicted adenylyl cyclase CyaB